VHCIAGVRIAYHASDMPHVFESAPTGRSKCRGCGLAIARGELRFGEALPNPFAEGEMTHWFHPACAACKRPEPLLQSLAETAQDVPGRNELERIAQAHVAHPRLQRIDGAERAPSGQARCRKCHEPIEKGTWRIRLKFHEEGQFTPGGFVHIACSAAYFETGDFLPAVLHFSPALGDAEREELRGQASAIAYHARP
jgi:Poly(ADP-ribose) polymerase and DNA-Ligase Zn-finger region